MAAGVYWIRGFNIPPVAPSPPPRQKATIPRGQAVIGYLDMTSDKPIISATQGKDVNLSGWAACAAPNSPLSRIEVLIDGRAIEAATEATPRQDVAETFDRNDFANSGWKTSFPTAAIPPGVHELSARVTCAKGESDTLPPFHLVVSASGAAVPAR